MIRSPREEGVLNQEQHNKNTRARAPLTKNCVANFRATMTGVVPTALLMTHDPCATCGIILKIPARSSSVPRKKRYATLFFFAFMGGGNRHGVFLSDMGKRGMSTV